MDDALVERWASGDPIARTALRNAIRSTAERVLGHPAFQNALEREARGRFASEDKRRELTGAIAEQVMRQRPVSAGQVKAVALMTAGRLAVEALQEGRAVAQDGSRHLPPAIVMQWTLVPESVNPRIKEASERHLESCSHCREDLRTLDRIVRTLDAVDHETSRAELAEEAAQVQSALDDTVDLQAAMRSAMAEARDERRSKLQSRSATPAPRTTGKTSKVLPGRTEETSSSPLRIWMPLVGVVLLGGGAIWAFSGDGTERQNDTPVAGLAALADRSPPEVARIEELPGTVQQVVADFGAGDCRTAAGRMRGIVRENPENTRLQLLEGASWVCAGNGSKALKTLEPLSKTEISASRPRQVWWFLAQAYLLEGDGRSAMEALSRAQQEDPAHRGRANAQLDQVKAALGG
jgi:glutaredoxin